MYYYTVFTQPVQMDAYLSEWLTNSKYNRQDSVGKLRGVYAHCFAWVVVMSWSDLFHIHRQTFIMILIIIKKIPNKYIIMGPLQLGPVTWAIFSQNHGIQPLIYKGWKTKTQERACQFLAFFRVQYNESMQEKTLYSVIPTCIHSQVTMEVKGIVIIYYSLFSS